MPYQPDLFTQVAPKKEVAPAQTSNAYYDKDGHLVHYCHCGEWGAYGYDVNLRNDKLGHWYCKEHRPDAKRQD
jgi:hypothetical protein